MADIVEYWVDTDSGTFGELNRVKVIRFDLETERLIHDTFVEASDNYRIEAADKWGINISDL